MSNVKRPDPSLPADLTAATPHLDNPAVRNRVDALGAVADKAGELEGALNETRAGLRAILEKLKGSDGYVSRLFREPSEFLAGKVCEYIDLDPANPKNDRAYERLLADMALMSGNLTEEDYQQITGINGRESGIG